MHQCRRMRPDAAVQRPRDSLDPLEPLRDEVQRIRPRPVRDVSGCVRLETRETAANGRDRDFVAVKSGVPMSVQKYGFRKCDLDRHRRLTSRLGGRPLPPNTPCVRTIFSTRTARQFSWPLEALVRARPSHLGTIETHTARRRGLRPSSPPDSERESTSPQRRRSSANSTCVRHNGTGGLASQECLRRPPFR
jgi:hypothetical protein